PLCAVCCVGDVQVPRAECCKRAPCLLDPKPVAWLAIWALRRFVHAWHPSIFECCAVWRWRYKRNARQTLGICGRRRLHDSPRLRFPSVEDRAHHWCREKNRPLFHDCFSCAWASRVSAAFLIRFHSSEPSADQG